MVKVLVPPICQDFKARDVNLCFVLSFVCEVKQLTRQPASCRVLGSAQGLPESDRQTMKEFFFVCVFMTASGAHFKFCDAAATQICSTTATL